jgi:hypothetical protein
MLIDVIEDNGETTLFVAGPIGHADVSPLRGALEYACGQGGEVTIEIRDVVTSEIALVRLLSSMQIRTHKSRITCHWTEPLKEPVSRTPNRVGLHL